MKKKLFYILLSALAFAPLLTAAPAHAATGGTLYSYNLEGSSAYIPNNAAANSGVGLTLEGDWQPAGQQGIRFNGNLLNQQSVGYAKPASGSTINVKADEALGVSVAFTYRAPTNARCFADSANITQIGRFGSGVGQIKLQLSNCNKHTSQTFLQCRIAGTLSTSSTMPITGTQALKDGQSYIARCYKSADPVSGTATTTLKTIRVDTVNGHEVTADIFATKPTGAIQSSSYLSVANKYALPSQLNNTDQFVGEISKVSFCKAASTASLAYCLGTDTPVPVIAQ